MRKFRSVVTQRTCCWQLSVCRNNNMADAEWAVVAARLGCGALLTSDRPPSGRRGEWRRGEERQRGIQVEQMEKENNWWESWWGKDKEEGNRRTTYTSVIYVSFEALPSNGCWGLQFCLSHVSGEQILLSFINSSCNFNTHIVRINNHVLLISPEYCAYLVEQVVLIRVVR